MSLAYYNEHDPYAAQWLRDLIAAGEIAPGDVDERDIRDVVPNEVAGYTQRHWFAGIGGWSLALRRAGFPDDHPIDTTSCPCQPFSQSGKRNGFDDERHLWPAMFHIISALRPALVMGEQVASALDWLDLVQDDLEGTGYAFRAADLCAAGVGAAHIRQRLYWMGHADGSGRQQGFTASETTGYSITTGDACGLADTEMPECKWVRSVADRETSRLTDSGITRVVADTNVIERPFLPDEQCETQNQRSTNRCVTRVVNTLCARLEAPFDISSAQQSGQLTPGHEPLCDWLPCRDGKYRPVEPGTFPLAPGLPRRVGSIQSWLRGLVDLGAARRNRNGRLKGYGNAINIDTAVAWILANDL